MVHGHARKEMKSAIFLKMCIGKVSYVSLGYSTDRRQASTWRRQERNPFLIWLIFENWYLSVFSY